MDSQRESGGAVYQSMVATQGGDETPEELAVQCPQNMGPSVSAQPTHVLWFRQFKVV